MFCKLYETKRHGQILVKLDTCIEDKPEIRFYTQPANLGVCSVAIGYKDTDNGWAAAEAAFAAIDKAKAIAIADSIPRMMGAKG